MYPNFFFISVKWNNLVVCCNKIWSTRFWSAIHSYWRNQNYKIKNLTANKSVEILMCNLTTQNIVNIELFDLVRA